MPTAHVKSFRYTAVDKETGKEVKRKSYIGTIESDGSHFKQRITVTRRKGEFCFTKCLLKLVSLGETFNGTEFVPNEPEWVKDTTTHTVTTRLTIDQLMELLLKMCDGDEAKAINLLSESIAFGQR